MKNVIAALGLLLLSACAVAGGVSVSHLAQMEATTVKVIDTESGHLGSGSGVVISQHAVLTARHVVSDADAGSVVIQFSDGTTAKGTVSYVDAKHDFAIVKFDAGKEISVADVNCDEQEWGTPVAVVGYPLGVGLMVTQGHVAATTGLKDDGPVNGSVLLDVSINHGNSGGPVFNDDGEVLGLAQAYLNADPNIPVMFGAGGNSGVGLMVPSTIICKAIADRKLLAD